MAKIKKKIGTILKLCYYAHHDQFDVIKFGTGFNFKNVRKCYLFAVLLAIVTVSYGILGLECESRPACQIVWSELPSSPYIFYHQMFPRVVWPQINMLMLTVIVFWTGCWVVFSFDPPIGRRFLILPDWAVVDEREQMCAFRKRLLRVANLVEITILICGIGFMYMHVLLINAVFNFNLSSLVFWALLNPIHVYGGVLCKGALIFKDAILICFKVFYTLPFYVILASKCIVIQQKTLINKQTDIIAKMRKIQSKKSSKLRQIRRHRLWLQYLLVNDRLCVVCKQLNEYSRFWLPYMTLLFAAFISLQCYGLYITLFAPGLSFVLWCMLQIITFGIVIEQFVLINQCAQVVKYFKRISLLNRTFYQGYSGRTSAEIKPGLYRNLIKAETLLESRLLYSYSFCLYGNYRITNKTFVMMTTYVCTFFLFIAKNKKSD